MWDTIVIGSGVGGLVAAAALARCDRRVLVLEQHSVAGGLTQTFRRDDWVFSTGVHYIGGVGPAPGAEGQFGRLLGWLSDGALAFTDCGNPYDIVRIPGFEFGIEHPEEAYRSALLRRFPAQHAAIDHWFLEMRAARGAAMAMFAMRGTPSWIATALRWWRGSEVERWSRRTLADALGEVPDTQLRAVLGARWGDYGAPPGSAPLLEHALVTGSYNSGSYYPVGGPSRFAQALLPVIRAAGGDCLLGASVEAIELDGDTVGAVTYRQGGRVERAVSRHVISAMGAHNTVACLPKEAAPTWQVGVRALRPGLSYVSLFLGFEGDIASGGASTSNFWVYESDDVGRVWRQPADEDAPGLFVSFPSLKDPQHEGGPTGEVIALCETDAFAPWLDLQSGERPEDYVAFKAWVEDRMLTQFKRHFPGLVSMIRFHELSTPVTQRHFVRSPDGAMYGLEMDHERLASPALNVRTPIRGLLLAGQDVFGAGVQSAAMSGLLAATAIEPRLLARLGS